MKAKPKAGISGKTAGKKQAPPALLAHCWQKGQSGNPKGRPSLAPFTDAIKRKLSGETEDGRTGWDHVVEAMYLAAVTGDVKAAAYLTDRIEGRAVQAVLTGKVEDDGTSPAEKLKQLIEAAKARRENEKVQ